mgnify:FL=1
MGEVGGREAEEEEGAKAEERKRAKAKEEVERLEEVLEVAGRRSRRLLEREGSFRARSVAATSAMAPLRRRR